MCDGPGDQVERARMHAQQDNLLSKPIGTRAEAAAFLKYCADVHVGYKDWLESDAAPADANNPQGPVGNARRHGQIVDRYQEIIVLLQHGNN